MRLPVSSRSRRTWFVLTLAWAAQIWFLSTSGFNSRHTESVLGHVLTTWTVRPANVTLDVLNVVIRKCAHLILYAVLALFIYRALGQPWSVWHTVAARRSVALAAAYGMLDEFHQLFVADRGASLLDCGIDDIGATVGILLIYWHVRTRQTVSAGGRRVVNLPQP